MIRLQQQLVRLAPFLFFIGIALVVAACMPGSGGAGASGGPTPTPSQAPLTPASPGANPIDLLAWLFTPIFQALFIVLVFFDQCSCSPDRQHRHRDPRADDRHPGARDPALPPPADLDPADAAPAARDQGAPAQVQGRPGQAERRGPGVLQAARHQPRRRLPAHPAPVRPPDPDVLGHQPGPHQLRPERDVDRVRGQPVPGHHLRPGADLQRRRPGDEPVPQPDRVRHQLELPGAGHHGAVHRSASASASSRSSRRSSSSSRRG